jgi:hypothetical protein
MYYALTETTRQQLSLAGKAKSMNHSEHEPSQPSSGRLSPLKITLIFTLGIAAFFLIGQHWAHLAGILPLFLILLCPLMHLFMHGGHGGHDHAGGKGDDNSNSKTP